MSEVIEVENAMLRSENIWLKQQLAAAQAEVERLRAMIVPGDAAAHEEHMAELRRLRAIEAKAREIVAQPLADGDQYARGECGAAFHILAAGDEA